MSSEQEEEYRKKAERASESSDYAEAGHYYTLAAHESLGKCDYEPGAVASATLFGLGIY